MCTSHTHTGQNLTKQKGKDTNLQSHWKTCNTGKSQYLLEQGDKKIRKDLEDLNMINSYLCTEC